MSEIQNEAMTEKVLLLPGFAEWDSKGSDKFPEPATFVRFSYVSLEDGKYSEFSIRKDRLESTGLAEIIAENKFSNLTQEKIYFHEITFFMSKKGRNVYGKFESIRVVPKHVLTLVPKSL